MIRVLIADDHQLMRQGLRALLEKANDIEVVGEARDGQEAIEQVERVSPDVILMDIAMPILDGLRATERINAHQNNARVLILSMYSDETLVRQALKNGAKGYLIKNGSREQLISAIRQVHGGGSFYSPGVSGLINGDSPNQ
ncbi:MAG: response regulator transcription factor [Chloroflexi bacterium]|nr:response regulator transcription factor [Chloroflexota bacterium]